MAPKPKTWIEVSKAALLHNVGEFRRIAGRSTALMAVVKANAYGHGLLQVARAVTPRVDWFGVDSVDEGLALRSAGIRKPTLILGYTPLARLRQAVAAGLRVTAYNRQTVRTLADARLPRPALVHLKVETGTTRQGVAGHELLSLAKVLVRSRGAKLEGLSTHFANIEDTTDHRYAAAQLKRFASEVRALERAGISPPIKHTACSAAALIFPETHFNLARIGIGMYGMWPSQETRVSAQSPRRAIELRPALTWKTLVAQVKGVRRGTPVSYGLTERVSRDSRVAVLPVGYWDGYDRKLSSVGEVVIRGRRAKVLGRVCMNMMMVDVTNIPGARPEDEAVLLGEQKRERVGAEELARKAGTINYEIAARINPLIPRSIV